METSKSVWLIGCVVVSFSFSSPLYGAPELGNDVVVGSFRMHVQIRQRRVVVMERLGAHAATFPSTRLAATFEDWDSGSGKVSISVSLENIGARSLFAPLSSRVLRIDGPKAHVANADAGQGPGTWRWIYDASLLGNSPTLAPGQMSLGKRWEFTSPTAKDFQVNLEITAGVPLAAGAGATIEGADGSSITVPSGAIPYEVLIDIQPVPESDVGAPLGPLDFGGAIDVTFQPTELNSGLNPPSQPLQISIPAPADSSVADFIVGQQVLIDFLADASSGFLREQLLAVDTAVRTNGKLVTQATVFPGVLGGGTFVFLAESGSGFASGVVSDAAGARPGAVVSNSTNTLVAVTNGAGQYTLFISGDTFVVTAFDPFRGSSGSTSGALGSPANIFLSPLVAPPVTRDGVRNGGFERGDLTSWATTGSAVALQQLGPTSTGVVILPTEGEWMGDITTGAGSVGGVGSSLKQNFMVPAGVRSLRLDFNFVSEEFPEFVGTIFDDSFAALITTPNGQSTFAAVSVNQSGGFQLIGDCNFPGGDSTCGQTGWREGSVDLSAFAGTATPITVELLFSANDAGDNIYDTHVLIDNIRFSTLWIDAKVISGATSGAARVRQETRNANEVLSQAGVNVRVRNVTAIADPGGLLDTDITWTTQTIGGVTKGVPTAEETQLLSLSRSATATDLNAYYVRSLTGLGALAIALGPDDFHTINILTNSGFIMADTVTPETLGHEIGHLLISPDRAGSALEHNVGTATNLMNTPRTVARTILNRQQSANINRVGAPLLQP